MGKVRLEFIEVRLTGRPLCGPVKRVEMQKIAKDGRIFPIIGVTGEVGSDKGKGKQARENQLHC